MSLTGHLDVFPLEEVLRLLARSYKSGCLRVDSPDLHGRVYLNNGSMALATVGSDEDLRRQLITSKLIGEEALRSAEVGGKSLTEVASDLGGNHGLADFFREEAVESLYRIRKPGRGQFVFNVDVAPRYRADTAFDVELCVSEADRRAAEWADIESVIPTIDLALRITPEAPDGEPVTLAPNTWRLVAAFEGAATVRSLADRLGSARFRVAKDLTALVRSGLVEAVAAPAPIAIEPEPVATAFVPEEPARSLGGTGFGWRETVEDIPAASLSGLQMETHQPETLQPEIQQAEPPRSEYGYQESVEPLYNAYDSSNPEPEPVLEQSHAEHEQTQEAAQPASYNQGWWTEPAEAGDTPAQDDATAEQPVDSENPKDPSDTFLDRVFAQLDENPEGQAAPQGITHGFLKRRRMSSIGADE
jgi:hypothetical protein